MQANILPKKFFRRDARVVARALLGKLIAHKGVLLRITETEAYLGADDPAAHTYRGKTARNAAMFEAGGVSYVYFIYGMHYCLNVVSSRAGRGEGVLLRAAAVVEGVELVHARRPKARHAQSLCDGPAKLTQALGVGPEHNGLCLRTSALRILDDGYRIARSLIVVGPRVGISQGRELPYRYRVRGVVGPPERLGSADTISIWPARDSKCTP